MLEGVKVLIVGAVEAFFPHEAPQALNQIEIGRIRRQKQQFDAQPRCRLEHEPTALIASIIHHHGNRGGETKQSDLLEQFAHAGGIDVAVIGHRNQLMGDGMQRPQDIEALPATGRTYEHAGKTPEPSQVGPEDEMGRIDEKDGSLTGFGLL